MKKGMDPEAVEQMASQIQQAGERVQELYTTAQNRVAELDWTGDDREQYVADFDSSVQQLVQQVKQQAEDFAERARQNATEQRDASA